MLPAATQLSGARSGSQLPAVGCQLRFRCVPPVILQAQLPRVWILPPGDVPQVTSCRGQRGAPREAGRHHGPWVHAGADRRRPGKAADSAGGVGEGTANQVGREDSVPDDRVNGQNINRGCIQVGEAGPAGPPAQQPGGVRPGTRSLQLQAGASGAAQAGGSYRGTG